MERGAEAVFGFTAAEAVGRSMDIIIPERLRGRALGRLPPDHGHRLQPVWRGRPARRSGRHQDRRSISIEFTIQMLKGPAGEILGPVAAIRNVTKRFQREKEMARRIKELEASASR